jgi:MFS family permease
MDHRMDIVGGVSIMGDFLHKFYPRVYEAEAGRRHVYDNYCRYDDAALQLYTSCLYVAALMATLVAGMLTRAHGHRASMLTAGLFFLLGTLLGAAAQNLAMLMLGRISLGIGIGFSNQAILMNAMSRAPQRIIP